MATCSSKKLKKIKVTTKLSCVKSGLTKGDNYKFRIKAQRKIGGKWKTISTGYTGHFTAGDLSRGKKYTNIKSIKVKTSKLKLKKGASKKITASYKLVKAGKKPMSRAHGETLRYLSSNTDIATVSKAGKIKAKAKGTCEIYTIGINGVWKAVKVTVVK